MYVYGISLLPPHSSNHPDCRAGYFMSGAECVMCPGYSNTTDTVHKRSQCGCDINRQTTDGDTTTTAEECSGECIRVFHSASV